MLTFRDRLETKEVILHDTHSHAPVRYPEAWLKVEGRKRGLLYPGYHFYIAQDGEHLMLRPLSAVGNHTLGYNKKSIGVCLEGGRRVIPGDDGEEIAVPSDTFTSAQKATLGWIYHDIIKPVYGDIPLRAHNECGRHAWQLPYPCPALDIAALRRDLSLSRL